MSGNKRCLPGFGDSSSIIQRLLLVGMLWLASSAASYNTGATLYVDGVQGRWHASDLNGPASRKRVCNEGIQCPNFTLQYVLAGVDGTLKVEGKMTQPSSAILEYLAGQREPMITLLAELVNIDSGSYNKAGVDAVGARLRAHLEAHDVACETIPNTTYGDCLRARVGGGGGQQNILIMGHRDTVFPDGTAAARPFHVEGTRATGPGVADMKSGLVMNTFVLEAFQRFGGAPLPLVGLYTSDEEIASPSSRPIIEAEARQARAVFNSEPGRPTGNVVSQRKGAAFLKLSITGKAVHSGVDHKAGISAIEALARKVQRLHALTDYDSGSHRQCRSRSRRHGREYGCGIRYRGD